MQGTAPTVRHLDGWADARAAGPSRGRAAYARGHGLSRGSDTGPPGRPGGSSQMRARRAVSQLRVRLARRCRPRRRHRGRRPSHALRVPHSCEDSQPVRTGSQADPSPTPRVRSVRCTSAMKQPGGSGCRGRGARPPRAGSRPEHSARGKRHRRARTALHFAPCGSGGSSTSPSWSRSPSARSCSSSPSSPAPDRPVGRVEQPRPSTADARRATLPS